jgi:P27 family predicted phage terminase small subunit
MPGNFDFTSATGPVKRIFIEPKLRILAAEAEQMAQGAGGGRPSKPTAVLKLQGTFRPGRHLRRGKVSAPGDLGDCAPPEWMSERQVALWHDILDRAPIGTLAAIDREIFAAYVELVDRHAQAIAAQARLDYGKPLPLLTKGPDGTPVASPYLGIANKCVLLMRQLQADLGFNPLARVRMEIAQGGGSIDDEPAGWGMLRRFPVIDGGKGGNDAA